MRAAVTITEEHLSFSENPMRQALLDALPGVEDAMLGRVQLGVGAEAHLTLRERPWWRLSRTVRVSLGRDAAEVARFAKYLPSAYVPATFTVRVPRSAVTAWLSRFPFPAERPAVASLSLTTKMPLWCCLIGGESTNEITGAVGRMDRTHECGTGSMVARSASACTS